MSLIVASFFASLTWIGHPDFNAPVEAQAARFCRFRNDFEGRGKLALEVTADERYVLFLDGRRIDRGPDRSSPEHWATRKLELEPGPGRHRLEAVVWQVGDHAPYAQMSAGRGGFALEAQGVYAETLSTSTKNWQVGRIAGAAYLSCGGWGACAFGNMFKEASGGFTVVEPAEWKQPIVVQAPIHPYSYLQGSRPDLWTVEPSPLPPQLDRTIAPGTFKAVAGCFGDDNKWTDADAADTRVAALNAMWREGRPFVLKPREKMRALLDLGDYFCAYPELTVRGGRNGEVRIGWSEALKDAKNLKGDRNAFLGKGAYYYADRFYPKGGDAFFTTPWWRCGRWVTLEAKAGHEPLEIVAFKLSETRYPFVDAGSFDCDDPSLADVRRLCLRGLEMCAHDMTFDCPYYEQQMYPGDSRVQLNVQAAVSSDDRLAKRVMELFDWSRESDGFTRFNYPSRHRQIGATYALCHLLMYGDFVKWRRDDAWLRDRLPGIRHTLAAFERLEGAGRSGSAPYQVEGADGLICGLPGWGFVDWTDRWPRGVAPDANSPERPSSVVNLMYALALRSAAAVERAVGDPELADRDLRRADRVVASVRARFFDARLGRIYDDVEHQHLSEHAHALAVLADLASGAEADRLAERLVTEKGLARCTVYFSYYLFEAYFKLGRGDLFLKRLDLWREYGEMGLATPLERPNGIGRDGKTVSESRSDCHAWGSHPLYFMTTGLAGITPAAPGFRQVRVAPSPGGLKRLAARCPHPDGSVDVKLTFEDQRVSGTVGLPPGVDGVFVWQGTEQVLHPGANVISSLTKHPLQH